MKTCSVCGLIKERHEFHAHSNTKDRLDPRCKECHKERRSKKSNKGKKSAIAELLEANPYLNKWRKRLNDLCINDAYVLPDMAVLRLPDVLTCAGVPFQRYCFADMATGSPTGASSSLRDMLELLISIRGDGEIITDYRHTLSCRRWHVAI